MSYYHIQNLNPEKNSRNGLRSAVRAGGRESRSEHNLLEENSTVEGYTVIAATSPDVGYGSSVSSRLTHMTSVGARVRKKEAALGTGEQHAIAVTRKRL